MANFKVNFVSINNTNNKLINFTNCCCPNMINVVCRDMEIGQKYYVSFDDTPTYRAQIFPSKYSFIADTQIVGFKIINGGLGYTSTPTITITGGGASTNAKATAVLTEKTFANNVKTKTISSISITNPGVGYTSIPTVTVTGGGGKGAVIKPILGNSVKNLTFFVAFGCNEKNMPIPTPYPSTTPTCTPTPTLTQTPTTTPSSTPISVQVLPSNVTTYETPIGQSSIVLSDYFADTVSYPVRVYSGATGQILVVPQGYNYVVYVKQDGSIEQAVVVPGQSIAFRSIILLGNNPNPLQTPPPTPSLSSSPPPTPSLTSSPNP